MTTSLNGRWPLELPEHRARQWAEWHAGGGWETERLSATHEAVGAVVARDGALASPVVYDIGAEQGDLPALWASWGARVVMVEPSAGFWPTIRRTFEMNDLEHQVAGCFVGFATRYRTVTAVAAVDQDQIDSMMEYHGRQEAAFTAGPWPTASQGRPRPDPGFCHLNERDDLAMICVDELVDRVGAPPDIITIDVEGAEAQVIAGAAGTLAEHRPVVFCSVHPEFMADRYDQNLDDDLLPMMVDAGYLAMVLAVDHEVHWAFWPAERTDLTRTWGGE